MTRVVTPRAAGLRAIGVAAFTALIGSAVTGCAVDDPASHPSFVGLSDLTPAAHAEGTTTHSAHVGEPHPALRHVKTNKLLGAMALHKVTGLTIAPERLSDSK